MRTKIVQLASERKPQRDRAAAGQRSEAELRTYTARGGRRCLPLLLPRSIGRLELGLDEQTIDACADVHRAQAEEERWPAMRVGVTHERQLEGRPGAHEERSEDDLQDPVARVARFQVAHLLGPRRVDAREDLGRGATLCLDLGEHVAELAV